MKLTCAHGLPFLRVLFKYIKVKDFFLKRMMGLGKGKERRLRPNLWTDSGRRKRNMAASLGNSTPLSVPASFTFLFGY
jgi:hypothetical protein